MQKRKKHLFLTSLLVLAMGLQLAVPALAQERTYNDYDTIVNTGIDLKIVKKLKIAQPAKDISTSAETYYITGTSDPSSSVTVNGEEVSAQGALGTFGHKVDLQMGANTFTVINGGQTAAVTITRTEAATAKTKKLSSLTPSSSDYAYANEEYELKCTAPSGSSVTAQIGGQEVQLKQNAATAEDGVPAWYSAKVTLSGSDKKVQELGPVIYTLHFGGETKTYTSSGSLTLVGKETQPVVEISQNSASIYEKDSYSSNFVSTLNQGARDKIVDIGSQMVKLSMGGWVKKDYIALAEKGASVKNKVTSADYEINDQGEFLNIEGTSPSSYKTYSTSEKVYIKFYNMKNMPEFSVKGSQLFSSARVTVADNATVVELIKKENASLLGYSIRYRGENIEVFFNPMPALEQGEQPLKNVIVTVDPGHGGMDSGALGVLNLQGPYEKDITMAHSIAVQKRLENLGATVVMTVPKDLDSNTKIELTDRYQAVLDSNADFFISLHCNSIGGSANDLRPQGTEIYYYESASKPFSDILLEHLVGNTGRTSRGTLYGNYYVTRNTQCPSLLVEMGFVTNPAEYDAMRTQNSIFQTANAVSDALLDYLA